MAPTRFRWSGGWRNLVFGELTCSHRQRIAACSFRFFSAAPGSLREISGAGKKLPDLAVDIDPERELRPNATYTLSRASDTAPMGAVGVADMSDFSLLVPSIDQLSRIIGSVAAPAFLLGAVAAFISVLISRMNRVIDRSQFLHGIVDDDGTKDYLKTDIPRLKRRAAPLNQSIFYSTVCAIITASLIIVAFVSAMLHLAHEYGVALLFIAALIFFVMSLVNLARETRIALHDSDHHV
jgi:uncharacterized protein DUF2721